MSWLSVTGAYNTSIVASSSRMFSRHRRLEAKSRSLGSVQLSQSTPAVWFDEPPPVPPARRGASVRHPPRTPSPPTTPETDQVDGEETGSRQPCREPSSPDDQASVPLLPRSVGGRSSSSDAVASSASASLVADCSPDRRSL